MIQSYLGYDFDEYTADTFPYGKVSEHLERVKSRGIRKTKSGRFYAKQICAFDIETTLIGDTERTAMHHWQFSFDNIYFCIGRTWEEFMSFIKGFHEVTNAYIINICVHNLSYEMHYMMQFIISTFLDSKIDALMLNNNAPLTIKVDHLHFIDTFKISGTSLAKMCKDYDLYYQKAVGDLDYKKRFNVNMQLTNEEKGYCLLDVASLVEWYHKVEELRGYTPANMPSTKTGFVRVPLRKKMKPIKNRYYDDKIDDYEVHKLLCEMFQGGLTCINPAYRNRTIRDDIRCKDFTSSYPAVMCGDQYYYPVTAYVKYADKLDLTKEDELEEFLDLLDNYCVLFRVRLFNIRLKDEYKSGIISSSKCSALVDDYRMNGKVVVARCIEKVTNEIELGDILEHYEYTHFEVSEIYTALRGKLPKVMREYILDLFQQKTQLKQVEGREADLMLVKADINAVYGCCAMNPLRVQYKYDPATNTTERKELSAEELESLYNKEMHKKNAFLHYRYGCYVTTWARHNIILAMDSLANRNDWLYTDTDSIYYRYSEENERALERVNKWFIEGQVSVKNEVTGKTDTLGMLCPDGEYSAFRGLGAKKYCLIKKDGTLKLTCAGVPKKAGGAMLHNDIELFKAGFVFSGHITNKLTPVRNVESVHYEDVNGVLTLTGNNIYMKETDYILSDSIFDDLANANFDMWV